MSQGSSPAPPDATESGALKTIGRHALVYGLAEQLTRVGALILLPLHTRCLDGSEYGALDLIAVSLALASTAFAGQMQSALARFWFDRDDRRWQAAVLGTTLVVVLGLTLLVALPLLLAADSLVPESALRGGSGALLIRLAVAVFLLQGLRGVLLEVLKARRDSRTFARIQIGKMLLEVALQIVLVAVLGMGLVGLFTAVLVGEAAALLTVSALVLPQTGIRVSVRVARAMAVLVLPLVPAALLHWALHSADRFVVAHFADTAAVGTYGLAYKLGRLPNLLALAPFLMIWYPFVFSLRDDAARSRAHERSGPFVLAVVTAIALAVTLAAPTLVRVLTEDPALRAAGPVVGIVAAAYWFWAVFQLAQTAFFVRKDTRPLPWLVGAAAAVNLLANVALVPRLGPLGAALGTLVALALLAVLSVRSAQLRLAVAWPWRRMLSPALTALAVVVVAEALLAGTGAPHLLGRAALGVTWFAWLTMRWTPPADRASAKAWVAGLLKRKGSRVTTGGETWA